MTVTELCSELSTARRSVAVTGSPEALCQHAGMSEQASPLKLYGDLATWWPLLSAPEDYEEEAAFYSRLLEEATDGSIGSLLELGSGGGNNALHMKARFDELTLVDLSPEMVEVSRSLNPDCSHAVGDMRTVRLERTFDAVFVHDAVCYMLTEDDLRQAMRTAYVHCRPGAGVLFAPDYLRETFKPGSEEGGHDEAEREPGKAARGLRYLAWVWDPDPDDSQYVTDYAYLIRDADGTVTAEHDRHIEGLFPRDTWLRLFSETGFENVRNLPLEHSEVEPGVHEVFVARRPR